jgi:ABC-2 type transport system ATP-binding protein/lipopolysaccharide transport system ATP-binding protein
VSETCVRVERVGKRFQIPRTQRTTLRAVRAMMRGEPLRRELWVLEDVSFEITTGTCTALIGRNGSGKTTLLRLLSGIIEPTTGVLEVRHAPRPLFSTSVGFVKELSVADNVYLFGAVHGMRRAQLAPRHGQIVRRAGIEHLTHAPLKDLSMGQVQRLALSIFAETQDRFLVFDEVLGNVDRGWARRADRFFRGLVESGRTVVMTSHDAEFLRAYCPRAIWIDAGRVRRDGPFAEVMREYESSFDDEDPQAMDGESGDAAAAAARAR